MTPTRAERPPEVGAPTPQRGEGDGEGAAASVALAEYVRGLGLDAYLVGGVVRDELLGRPARDADFLVAGLDSAGLRAALARHGRVEELSVAGTPVGMRLYPRAAAVRALAPAGIEFAPLRRERSTGPGRHDFEIVVDPGARVEDDLARRDFTVNAIARRLGDGLLVDPFDGRGDLARGLLRTVTPRGFDEDPLRLVRGLRFVSELALEPDAATLAQMRAAAAAVAHVSAERIGGGLSADGMGELSKLLLGARPAHALRLARDVGVLTVVLPELAPAVGLRRPGDAIDLDEHLFAAVQRSAEGAAPLALRLAGLLHDAGRAGVRGEDDAGSGAARGAGLAEEALTRLRYPTALRARVAGLVSAHPVDLGAGDARAARALLAARGAQASIDLLDLRAFDLSSRARDESARLAAVAAFRALVEAERGSPHRLADLAVDGRDLRDLGFEPGPALGAALARLLADVVDEPTLNTRETLLARAAGLPR